MDAGFATGAFGERFFGVSAFAGAAAEMAERANRRGKRHRGVIGYLPGLPSVMRFRADVQVAADGEAWTGAAISVQAANAPYGGGLRVHPSALLDDGLLDLMVIRAVPLLARWALLGLLPLGLHPLLPFVSRRAVREVTLAGGNAPLCLDGEIVGTLPARISVRRHALKVIAPARRAIG
jgi:diacylglycerol kinase family enzyme